MNINYAGVTISAVVFELKNRSRLFVVS